jgi:tetratricopeptide (TPR) repeat protein
MKCETIEELERFREIQEQALGKASPEVASTVRKIANLHLAKGSLERAEELNQIALVILRKSPPRYHAEIEETERALQDIKDERAKSQPAMRISGNPLGGFPAANETTSQTSMEGIKPVKGFSHDAIKEMELEVTLLKQTVGRDHPAIADSLTKLADLYCRAKLYGQMEPLLIEALRIRESTLGPEHPSVSTELKNLAQLYVVQEKYSMAELLFRRALTIREKALGSRHPKVIDIQEQYAKLLKKTSRVAQGQELEKHVHEVRTGTDIQAISTIENPHV